MKSKIKLPSRGRWPHIVVVDDEPCLVEMTAMLLRQWKEHVTLALFTDSTKAWEELSQTDPDLLITDDMMPRLLGEELVGRLLVGRKVSYPIIVRSAMNGTEEWVRRYANEGLDVSFLPSPHDIPTFLNLVEASLIRSGVAVRKPNQLVPPHHGSRST